MVAIFFQFSCFHRTHSRCFSFFYVCNFFRTEYSNELYLIQFANAAKWMEYIFEYENCFHNFTRKNKNKIWKWEFFLTDCWMFCILRRAEFLNKTVIKSWLSYKLKNKMNKSALRKFIVPSSAWGSVKNVQLKWLCNQKFYCLWVC